MMWRSFSKLPFTLISKIYLKLIFEYGENYSFSVGSGGLLFLSLNKLWFFFPEILFQIQIWKTLLFGMKFCTGHLSFSTLKMPLHCFCLPLFLLRRHLEVLSLLFWCILDNFILFFNLGFQQFLNNWPVWYLLCINSA